MPSFTHVQKIIIFFSSALVALVMLSKCESEDTWHARRCEEISREMGLKYTPTMSLGRRACMSTDTLELGRGLQTQITIYLDER